MGASATVSNPELLAKRLFGVGGSEVIQPSSKEKKSYGIEYFILHAPPANVL